MFDVAEPTAGVGCSEQTGHQVISALLECELPHAYKADSSDTALIDRRDLCSYLLPCQR
jgi:hypothetical protein